MKHLLLTTIAAVVLVGCGPSVDIHEAARTGNIEAIKQHLNAGTDVNVEDNFFNRTSLHNAAEKGHKEIVELLIANGANMNAIIVSGRNKGKTPLDLAIWRKKTETADLLRKHGGRTAEEIALMPRLTYDRGLFGFTFNTIEGKTYRVESGMDLIKWNSLGDIIGTGGEVKFIDARRIYFPYHFYRVKVVE